MSCVGYQLHPKHMDALGVSKGQLVHFKWKSFYPKSIFSESEMFMKHLNSFGNRHVFNKGVHQRTACTCIFFLWHSRSNPQ